MIVDFLWSFIQPIVSIVFNTLPTSTIGAFAHIADDASYIGQQLGLWNWLIPVTELVGIGVTLITVMIPAILLYKLANWIWRHIPDLWGFGPGAG